jgi:coatomer protein complex subunit alpha (xenin)
MPTLGHSASHKWAESGGIVVPGALVAAGAFDMAQHMLHTQAGIVNFGPMRDLFLQVYQSAYASLPTIAGLNSIVSALHASRHPDSPILAINLNHCVDKLKIAYKLVTDGKFGPALEQFQGILCMIPLISVENKAQAKEAQDLLSISREYITAMRLELLRRDEPNAVRQFELSVYFTKCELQPIHVFLGLRVAIKCGYSIKNFKTTGALCRRLLELCVTAKLPANLVQSTDQIKNVLKACEKSNTDAEVIRFDDRAYALCCESFVPLYRNQPQVVCPYCRSAFAPSSESQLCNTCQLGKIGVQADGLAFLKL